MIKIIQNSYNEVFPIRRVSNRRIKMKRKPWMCQEILSMIKEKHKYFKRYLKNKTPGNLSLYKEKRNKIKREVEKAKKQYYYTYFSNCKNDIKKTWQGLNTLTNRNVKTASQLPKYIKVDDGNFSTDPNFIINKLNKTFVQKGPKLAAKLPHTARHSSSYLKKRVDTSMKFERIN